MAVKKKTRKSRQSLGREGSPRRNGRWATTPLQRWQNQRDAWEKGKRVMLTIPNPDKNATNARFIKVEARQVWGLPPCEKRRDNAG